MKKTLLFAIILFVLKGVNSYAQGIEGVVKDSKTQETLPYVNIGLIGKATGTVTDAGGVFKLIVNDNDSDSLKISMIGYRPQTYLVGDLKKQTGSLNISLEPKVTALKEVKIYNRKFKEAILGNTTESKSSNAGFTSNQLGNEIGEIIKIKRSPTRIKRFNASMSNPLSTDSVKLRLNFYSVVDGMPDKILQQQNIFITVKKGQDKISVNLELYDIVVEDKFFVSLEWIENTKGRGIMFSASLFSSAIIAREASQGKWEKTGLAGVGFNVLAEY
jgi:hypothetical protein